MAPAVLSPAARRDLLAAVGWIAEESPSAAAALRSAVILAAARIGEFPAHGSLRPELVGEPYRFLVLSGFPYVVVYNARRRPPAIVRILHGARDLEAVLRGL